MFWCGLSTKTRFLRFSRLFDMRTLLCYVFIFLLYSNQLTHCFNQRTFVNKYAVHIEGGIGNAQQLAVKHGFTFRGQIGDLKDIYELEHPHIAKRSTSHSHYHHKVLSSEPAVKWFEQQEIKIRKKRDLNWNDKLYPNEWYLHGGGKKKDEGSYDMSVIGAWKMGYTGKGIVVTILDDGIEHTHDDLKDNYDPYASYDVNAHDSDPIPRYDPSNENRHGTRCAGEVSAKANNTACIVGVAYNSGIGGVRMLDGDVYDAVEARSLSFNRTHIDIYSASWGPDDDGRVVDGPGVLAKKAFTDGIAMGRGGKGSIFVWASGNGGSASDSCNCDGYTNSIYTLSISSTSEHGTKPWYLEECSSTLATTYSSGAYHEKQVVTVDLHNKCTSSHTGTSASAPLAAGIVALILEANPYLTWRDVQFITMRSANPEPMFDGNWIENGKGRKVSLRYGYGLMNATAMVQEALVWRNVPEQHICTFNTSRKEIQLTRSGYSDTIISDSCSNTRNEVNHLEHVQAQLFLSYRIRGQLVIHLTSPSGTKSTLLPKRPNDYSDKGFNGWAFLSVHFWGENPAGSWKLEIEDAGPQLPRGEADHHKGTLHDWRLILHGTKTEPVNLKTASTKQPYVTKMTTVRQTFTSTPPIPPLPSICHKECKSNCSGPLPEECLDCKHFRMGNNGACVEKCPPNYRQNNNKCVPCEASCDSCTTIFGYRPHCERCKPQFYMLEGEGQCVAKCPEGYYTELSVLEEKICKKCARHCEACVEQADKCTVCPSGLLMNNHRCTLPSKICPQGYFKDVVGCHQCDQGCEVCDGRSKCIRCQTKRLLYDGNCIYSCPKGHLPYSIYDTHQSFQKKCVPCQKGVCKVCPAGFNWDSNSCVQESPCDRQTYFDWKTMKCQPCYKKCETCIGPGPDECSSCNAPLMYHASLRTCLPCCARGEAEVTCCHCNAEQGKCLMKPTEKHEVEGILTNYKIAMVIAIVVIVIIVIFLGIFIIFSLKNKPSSLSLSRFTSEKLGPHVRYEKLLQNDNDNDF